MLGLQGVFLMSVTSAVVHKTFSFCKVTLVKLCVTECICLWFSTRQVELLVEPELRYSVCRPSLKKDEKHKKRGCCSHSSLGFSCIIFLLTLSPLPCLCTYPGTNSFHWLDYLLAALFFPGKWIFQYAFPSWCLWRVFGMLAFSLFPLWVLLCP